MKTFEYGGYSQKKTVCGHIQAGSAEQARHLLREQGIAVLSMREQGRRRFSLKRRLNANQRALFTRQLATLLEASVPLVEALLCVSKQSEEVCVTRLAMSLQHAVMSGDSLSAACHQHESSLGPLFSAMVQAGETSGQLVQVLLALADHIEQQASMRQSLQQALLYPLIMTSVAMLVVAFLLWRVVPIMIESLNEAHQALPWPTLLLLHLSEWFHSFAWLVLSIVLALVLLIRGRYRQRLKKHVLAILMRVPGISSLVILSNTTRFIRALSVLQAASVPLTTAIQTASLLVRWPPMYSAIQTMLLRVQAGVSLASALSEAQYFSPMCVQMVRCGEQTGELSSSLQHVASWQSNVLSQRLSRWMTLFEPALMIIMGVVVLFIVLSVMLPIFSMDQISGM